MGQQISLSALIADAVEAGLTPAEVRQEYEFIRPQTVYSIHWRCRNRERFAAIAARWRRKHAKKLVPGSIVGKWDWTSEEEARLIDLRAEGHSMTQIGRHLGRTRDAIAGKIHRLRKDGTHVE